MFFHAVILIALCVSFPLLSKFIIEPMVMDMYGSAELVLSDDNFFIMVIMVVAVFIVPMLNYILTKNHKYKKVISYMGGANAGDNKNFVDSSGEPRELQVSNWYMEEIFGEKKILLPAILAASALVVVMMTIIIGGAI